MKQLLLILTTITFFASFAFADHHEGKGHMNHADRMHRQKNQNKRIRQGVKSGQLTKEETLKLRKQQLEIREKKLQMRADGKIDKEERKEIQKDLKQSSKDIYAEKHDAETKAPPAAGAASPATAAPTEVKSEGEVND